MNSPDLCVCGHPRRRHGKRGCLMSQPHPDPRPVRWDENGAEVKWAKRLERCRCKRSRKTLVPMFRPRA